MTEEWYGRAMLRVTLAMGVLFLFFNLFPEIDVRVSSWFHNASIGQWTASDARFHTFREIFNTVSVGFAALCLVLWAIAARRGPVFTVPQQIWGFVPLLYLIGPGLLVNGILKNYWGRARPADVAEFGGDRAFTPPFRLSDQCVSNCSFASGEGSGAAAFFIGVLVLSASIPRTVTRRIVLSAAFMFALVAAALRVAKGRHFFSDTLFSVLFVCMVALFLHWLLHNEKYLRTSAAVWKRGEAFTVEFCKKAIAAIWKDRVAPTPGKISSSTRRPVFDFSRWTTALKR